SDLKRQGPRGRGTVRGDQDCARGSARCCGNFRSPSSDMSRSASLLPAVFFLVTGCTLSRSARAPEGPSVPVTSTTAAEIADAHAREATQAAIAQAEAEVAP